MVKQTLLTFGLLVLDLTLMTHCLECFTCSYFDHEEDSAKNPSCKNGEHPVERYLRNCQSWDWTLPDSRTFLGNKTIVTRNKSNTWGNMGEIAQEPNWYCAKIDFDGYIDSTKFSGGLRHCWPMFNKVPSTCRQMNKLQWTAMAYAGDEFAIDIYWMFEYFTNETWVSGCLCDGDKCNGAVGKGGHNNVGFVVGLVFVYILFKELFVNKM